MSFPFDAIRLQINQSSDGILRDRSWIERSLADPDSWAAAVFRYATERSTSPSKSQLGIAYDFYHDAVTRHATGSLALRPCFLFPGQQPSAPLSSLTYAQLHTLATQLAAEWGKRGVGSGVSLCIIYPTSAELVVALCAALKLGAVIYVLPPLGPDFLATRLQAIKPNHVVTALRYQPLLKEWYGEQALPLSEALLPEVKLPTQAATRTTDASLIAAESTQGSSTSHSYEPAQTVFGVCSEQREPSYSTVPVTAAAAYIGALTDGFLIGVNPKSCVLTAPEHSQLQYTPLLLLMLLLHGGTYLHVGVEELSRASEETPRLPMIDILLMSSSARDEFLHRPARPLREVRSWLCAVTETSSPYLWRDWIDRCGLDSIPATCWHYDAASAGCLLFSLQRKGQTPQIMYPTPGKPFHLKDPAVEDQPARGPNGILRPLPGACGLLLYEYATGFIYGGTRWPTRSGRSMAAQEVEQVVSRLPFVAGAVMAPEPSDRGQATLLVFIGPHMQQAGSTLLFRIEQSIRHWIGVRLGRDYVPMGVHILATLPRRNDSGIDRSWCIGQHRTGQLATRAQDPVLHLMDRLRFACHRASTPLGHMVLHTQNKRKQEQS